MRDKRAQILCWLDEQEALCRAATQGPWKLWGMTVMDDPTGTSNHADCREIADTFDPDRGLRTFYATFIAQARTVLPLALAALRAEVEAHTRWGIYDECGHDHKSDDELGVLDVEHVGLTCEAGLIQPVCRVCHLVNDEPTEETSECSWPCSTIDRLHGALAL